MSKIVRFTAENFKKLKAVEIYPDDLDNVVIISGKNAQGKSSIIECIWSIFESYKFPHPINNTKTVDEESYGEIELEDLIIRRHWTADDRSYLNILTKDGAKYPSPQAMIDKMKGAIALDPAEFQMIGRLNDGAKKQVEYLISALKINTKTIDIKFKTVYQERTDINREHTRIKALLKDLPEPQLNLPDEEVPILNITAEMEEAVKSNEAIEKIKVDADKLHEKALAKSEEHKKNDAALVELQKKIETLKEQNNILLEETIELEKQWLAKDKEYKSSEKVDISSFQLKMHETEELNKKIRNRNKRSELENEMGELFEKANEKTQQLEELKTQKSELISKANFPIEGLFYDETGIYVNDIPFVQMSESEQFKFSTLIAMAANPELRVIASKHGGIFDEKNLALLIELTKDKDYQLWLEKVDENKLPTVIIEEGKIKSIRKKS